MNRIYRKVWNKALGQMVVASELATGQSAGVVIDQRRSTDTRATSVLSAAIALTLGLGMACLLYTSPSPRDGLLSRMPSSA